jgi:metallo-beta-lactamase family protein
LSIRLEFVGGAGTVTGSRHLVHTPDATILLDCGLYQGRRLEARRRNHQLGFDESAIDAVVLSHAHIDHSGALPVLCKRGYDGAVYATPATRDLCAVMLQDSANIQAADARYLNRAIERGALDSEPIETLYDQADVERLLERVVTLPYRRKQTIARGVELTFLDAGHVLGSAIPVLDIDDAGQRRRLVFTGDLGRRHMPILRDPEVPSGAHVLLCESTYGDRLHSPIAAMDQEIAEVIERTRQRGGKVVIPSFALERAQEVVFSIKKLREAGRLPKVPVYIDSPLTVRITDVFRMHPDCYDEETRSLLQSGSSPFEFDGLRYVASVEESMAIDRGDSPSVIIAASGMCEAGRVLHHLKTLIGDPRNTVLIVGFQAEHTLGRRLVERRERVRIFGVEHALKAEVVVLNGFSAHADQADLVAFAEAARERGPLRTVVLVHGEPKAQRALKDVLAARHFPDVRIPDPGDVYEV